MTDLNYRLASAVEGTAAPPVPKASAWAARYTASGSPLGPLLNLSQGVPGTPPHPSVLTALGQAASDPSSAKYGDILGDDALRAAFAEEIRVQYRLPTSRPHRSVPKDEAEESTSGAGGGVNSADIAITSGANMAILLCLMTLCPPGSTVLLPIPAYFNNLMDISFLSLSSAHVPCDPSNGFRPSLSHARQILDDDTQGNCRVIALVSPNNPTGTVLSPTELKEWFDLAKEKKIALVLDETYRDFVESSPEEQPTEDGQAGRGWPHRLFEERDWRGTLISVGSFSKGYRIPGHRLGSLIASSSFLQHLATVADCMQINAPRIPQRALAPLLPSLRSDLVETSQAIASRRTLFQRVLAACPGWEIGAIGGYFAFVAYPAAYMTRMLGEGNGEGQGEAKGGGSEGVARLLAEEFGVVTLPSKFFVPAGYESPALSKNNGASLDRWLRFAVANVDDRSIELVGPRLREMNRYMGMTDTSTP